MPLPFGEGACAPPKGAGREFEVARATGLRPEAGRMALCVAEACMHMVKRDHLAIRAMTRSQIAPP